VFAWLDEQGVDPAAPQLQLSGLRWVPRSGSQKTGLQGLHGDERKDATLEVGPRVMRNNGDEDAAAWAESLRPRSVHTGLPLSGKRKPMEDVCDAYLQGHHYLLERLGREQVEERKAVRAANAQAKREAKAERQRVREEKQKRKREDAEDGNPRPKKKRLRRSDGQRPTSTAVNTILDLTMDLDD
jgi:hypothetical protein